MTPIMEINNKLMKILGIEADKDFISEITVTITPDNYPEVIITKLLFKDDTLTSAERFQLVADRLDET